MPSYSQGMSPGKGLSQRVLEFSPSDSLSFFEGKTLFSPKVGAMSPYRGLCAVVQEQRREHL